MIIYGVSQSSGVERKLQVEMGAHGLVLIFIDHKGGKEQGRIMVPVDDVLVAITEPTPGGATVEGIVPPFGPKMQLSVEVGRNEVLLKAGDASDVAVGLDDFQDALESVITRG
jgi:hypothetical protein